LSLERALAGPARGEPAGAAPTAEPGRADGEDERVLTASDLRALERRNIVRALERSGWRVAGADGAAALLDIKPSTLASRMKALGIQRP
jgi:transcriptional regulator with GAF, ATPase, and Fis domain